MIPLPGGNQVGQTTRASHAFQQAFASLRLCVTQCLQGWYESSCKATETSGLNGKGKTAHAWFNGILTQRRQDAKNCEQTNSEKPPILD